MILQGEVKDAKRSSFSSDFQTLIKHQFSFVFLYELLMSFRNFHPALLLTSLSKVIDKSGDIQSTKSKKKECTTENRREIDILHLEVPSTQTHLYTITFQISNN